MVVALDYDKHAAIRTIILELVKRGAADRARHCRKGGHTILQDF